MVWIGLGEGIEGILNTGGIASATDVRQLILTLPSGLWKNLPLAAHGRCAPMLLVVLSHDCL